MSREPAVAEIILNEEEETKLEEQARRRKTCQAMALRCRIVPESAKGRGSTTTKKAEALKVSMPTVGK